MSHRIGLSIVTFVLAGSFGVADTVDVNNEVESSRHCRTRNCTVGEVQPFLALQNENFLHLWFEGVATDKDGSVYTQEQCTGDVYRIRPSGKWKVIATIPYGVENNYTCDYAGGLGLAVSDDGDIWVVVFSWLDQSHGVWRIHPNGRAELAVPLPPAEAALPNAITFDPEGNLYITESWGGAVWKARPGGTAELWLQGDLLAPIAPYGFGANGIVYMRGALYVANSDQGTIVKIPLRRDGSPGNPVVIANGLNGPDGVTVDAFGNLYLVTAWGAQLVRIRPRGTPEIVLDMAAAGVSYPTGVDIGKIVREMNTAYIANFIPKPGEPNLVKVNLCQRDSR
jgi:sugar lactone lactonase YvrE